MILAKRFSFPDILPPSPSLVSYKSQAKNYKVRLGKRFDSHIPHTHTTMCRTLDALKVQMYHNSEIILS